MLIMEIFLTEINLRTKKYEVTKLRSCFYDSPKNNIGTYYQPIDKTLYKLSTSYDSIILLGDFNVVQEHI